MLISSGIYAFYFFPNQKGLDAVRTMPIQNINLANMDDGSYKGEYSYGSYTYQVEVQVKKNRIEDIHVIHNRDTSYAKKAEGVIHRVLGKQALDVNAVSGATTTSKALLKAMENALKSGSL